MTCSLVELAFVPVEIVDDLLPARLQAGQAELAAELVGRLGQRHLVAALGRNPRRFEPGDAAADDEHLLRPRGAA